MADRDTSIAEPHLKGGMSISPIWLVPIVAVLIGGWLVYQTINKQGPKVSIEFETADGIEEGKTKLKFRDVQVGLVETVRIKEDLSGVIVSAELKKEAEPFITDQTRFWVVRPRIDAKGISGLGTLVSGAFIEVDPGEGGDPKRDFIGLKIPPLISTNDPGKEFVLVTEKLGSYSTGSPIYYRGLEVGEVLGHELHKNRKEFLVHIFIHAPHDNMVKDDSRFWNASGINVSIGADGMKMQIESLQTLALGGLAFDTLSDINAGTPSPKGATFRLHNDKDAISEAEIRQKFRWVLYFDGSVRGLSANAPVEFKGIKVGTVVDVNLELNRSNLGYRIPVLVDIEPERIKVEGNVNGNRTVTRDVHIASIKSLIDAGLKARLKTGNLLTGQLIVDLDYYTDKEPVYKGDQNYPEIPTLPSSIEEITRSLTAFLDKIQALPIDELTSGLVRTVNSSEKLINSANKLMNSSDVVSALASLERTLSTIDRVMVNVDENIAPQAYSALSEAHQTLKTVREAVGTGSPLRYDLETTLGELAGAARSIRLLAEYLESNPNALIYGKGGNPQ